MHLVVPEAKHLKPGMFKPRCPQGIMSQAGLLPVLIAVQLDDKSQPKMGKVGKIGPERHLTSEMTSNINKPELLP